MDSGIEHRYAAIVSAMLAQPLGDKARVLSIDGTARVEWAEFADAIEHRLREDGDLRLLAGWASKAAGAVARIAGCLHAAEHAHSTPDGAPIAPETVKAAVEIVDYFVHHALAAFGVMGDSPDMVLARRVAGWIDRHPVATFSLRDLHQGIRTESPQDLLPALRLLEQRWMVRELPPPPPNPAGGRPSQRFAVNPQLENRSQNPQNLDSYGGSVSFVNDFGGPKTEEQPPTGSEGVSDTEPGVTDTEPPQAEGEDAFRRYLPPSEKVAPSPSAHTAENSHSQKVTGSNGVTDTKSRNPAPTAEGYGVTDTQPPQAEGEDAATDEPPPSDPSFADEEESTLPPPEVLEV